MSIGNNKMAVYTESSVSSKRIRNANVVSTISSKKKTQIPRYTVTTIYLLYLGFALATARHSGASEMGTLGELVRILTLGPAYLLALAAIITRTNLTWQIITKCKIYLVFIVFSGLSVFWVVYPSKVLLHNAHDIGYFMVGIVLLIMLKERGSKFLFKHLAIASLAFIAVSIFVSIAMPSIGTFRLTRWQGVAGNPNTLGMFCVVCVWSLLMLYNLHTRFFAKLMCLFFLVVPFLALKGGKEVTSITSLLMSLLLCLTIPFFVTLSKGNSNARLIKFIFAFFLIIIGITSLVAFLPEVFNVDYILAKLGRDRTMTGRTRVWDMGWEIFNMKPWFGWGFDALLSVMHTLRFDISQFHNGYLDLAVRGGIIGFTILMLMIFVTYRGILKIIRQDSVFGWGLAAFATALLLHNMAEASIMRPTHLYWFTFVLVYLISCNYKWLFPRENKGMSNGAFR
ncbi:O-antigen ligase family protein [Methylotuvimicrobium sp. KM1]|uniref:O-antigen ligase family protein n=1 Tax=Methylotuvimicrobium sp. KM1 TaxID=3377707 RepID=UPI00384B22A9